MYEIYEIFSLIELRAWWLESQIHFHFHSSPLSIILEIIHDFANINANYPANIGGLNRKGSLNNTFSDMWRECNYNLPRLSRHFE